MSRGAFVLALIATALLTACGAREEKSPTKPKARISVDIKIRVGEPMVIGPGEDLRTVRVPSPLAPDIPAGDSVCVIYRNETLRTAQLICPAGVEFPDYLRSSAED